MPSIQLDCPHCGSSKSAFSLIAQHTASVCPQGIRDRIITFSICPICEGGLILEFSSPGVVGAFHKNSPMACSADPCNLGFTLIKSYPATTPPRIPTHISDELKRYFTQASNAANRADWDASGAMSRKVVDVSSKQLLGEECNKYRTTKARIDALADKSMITQDLKEWAHEIRLGGNDAVHEEDPYTETEAHELVDFADLYLTYVYTLPGRLKERRERAIREKSATKS